MPKPQNLTADSPDEGNRRSRKAERNRKGSELTIGTPRTLSRNRVHAETTAHSIPRSALPCDEPRRSAGEDFLRRCRLSGVFEDLRPGVSKDRLASACLLSDGESFSSCLGDAAGESGRGNEMVAGNLYAAVQSAASANSSEDKKNLDIVLPSQISSAFAKPGYEEVQ